ncbi:M23 family metallopeptidase [Hyphomonas sp.]|uniref:M23 family metallopeptidase n=1 Tax=Hyphomonas sp. TaxID=87 RepID=UPI003D2C0769
MLKKASFVLAAFALTGLAACDFIRFPGDGGPPPNTPEPAPATPPGAPGPPPPGAPVDNPYGDTDTSAPDTPEETETPDSDPVSDDDPVKPPDTDVDVPDDTPTDVPPATDPADTPDSGDTVPGATDPADDPVTPPADPTDTADAPDTPVDPVTPTEPEPAPEPVFSYHAPGALLPGTGQGSIDQIVHAPDIVFPIAGTPAYLQSQVFTFGGGVGGGDQCDARNYAYPWRDNFCETRSANRGSPLCPAQKIHQGQDIRVGTPAQCNTLRRASPADRTLHEAVAVEDGVISNVGSYSVSLRAGGRIYKYLHLNMARLKVKTGDTVTAGQSLGFISNDFGGSATTFHLHFEIVQNTGDQGWIHVPPYLSLVEAYERRENGPGEEVEQNLSVASVPFVIPEGMEIVE